jgi:Cu2+-exporting ATPase
MFIFFLSLGRHIEMMLRHRNLQAGTALARLLPEWAERITDAGRETIPSSDLVDGDRVLVRVGESFPADGLIRDGVTDVDEALLTGESRAIARRCGDAVIAGTINLSQPVEVEVTASGQETTISSLGRLLLLAQSRRPASSGIPAWLVPVFIIAVLLIAGGTWLGWQYVDPGRAFSAMLSVLVASCPCALSLALPVVYAAASHRLLDEGILLTRGEALQALTRIDSVVFDKTGTLTRGVPEITRVEINPDRSSFSAEQAIGIAAAIEAASAHPIARAFWQTADESAPSLLAGAENVTVHPASGLEGRIEGVQWKIGKADFAAPAGQVTGDDSIWLVDSESWVARFELQDALREDAQSTVALLRREGMAITMLSGDSREAVDHIADRLGIEDRYARQSPEMKLDKLESMRQGGRHVLMIGDGVNDAPVLAAADVSMTVKGGAELANSAADMILTSDSLGLVSKAIDTARRTRHLVRQNLTWAVIYNASVVPLAIFGMLKPWMAALGMSLSSLLVVANASRLVRRKP